MTESPRTIAVFTGNRAEYGLQLPILRAIDAHPDLTYRLIVSGAHLDGNFGRTIAEIESDGFEIAAEVDITMAEDSLVATTQAISSGILSTSKVLQEIQPDIFVVYADRFEGFAAVIAGTQMRIPTAHIEGGDITEGGALDDSVRHAMTKLAHLHFTTNADAAWRIRQMGEEPWRVHNVGFPAIDLIAGGNYEAPDKIVSRLGLDPAKPVLVITQHSVATQFEIAAEQIQPLLDAMEKLASEGCQIVLTYPNNAAGGRRIIATLDAFATRDLAGVQLHKSLGRAAYHGLLAFCGSDAGRGVCIGNSSSGIKETPAFACPAIDVGTRQDGRLRGDNVIQVGYDRDDIVVATRRALSDEFRQLCRDAENPYGEGGAGRKVADILASVPLDEKLIIKKMTIKSKDSPVD